VAHDQHESFIKTPSQLVVVILASFLVPIIGIVMLVHLVTSRPHADPQALTPEAVAARLQPVARLEIGSAAGADKPVAGGKTGAAAKADGKSVYDKVCFACHAQSVAGSPKLGDKAAWAPRIRTGVDVLVQSVIKGKNAMPPKGGNPSLSDAEVRAAVEFMVSQAK
jgi:cytochrome c5